MWVAFLSFFLSFFFLGGGGGGDPVLPAEAVSNPSICQYRHSIFHSMRVRKKKKKKNSSEKMSDT